jgi:hypothetical protein
MAGRDPSRSAEPHREAGGRALNSADGLDSLGDAIAEAIQIFGFELDDDIERTGDGIDGDNAGVAVSELLHRLTDGLGAPNIRFD